MRTTKFVNVPVPEQHVTAVYGFLVDLDRNNGGSPAPDTPNNDDDGPTGEWTEDLVARMLRESNHRPHDAMVLIARAGDDGISTEELADRLGYDHGTSSVAGMLGALTKRCKSRYGVSEPYTRKWPDHDGGEHDTLLFLPEPVRGWVLDHSDDPS